MTAPARTRYRTPTAGREYYLIAESDLNDTRLLLPDGLPQFWMETLSGREIRAGAELQAAELFAGFPCALLSGVY